jgi:hypothetical protein
MQALRKQTLSYIYFICESCIVHEKREQRTEIERIRDPDNGTDVRVVFYWPFGHLFNIG